MTGLVGSLADTPLAQVFRRIASEERSGDLQVTVPDAIKTIYFDRGFIVFASSNRKRDRLGESMVEAGRISKREFTVASELMKASRVKFGRALVSSGIVSEEELGHYVAAQVNRIALSLFSAKRGVYSFDERPTVIPTDIMVSLSVYRILLEGIRHMTSKNLVVAGLPPLDADLQIVDQPPFALDLAALRNVERDVLKVMSRGPTTIRVVIDQVGGHEGVVLRAVYGLVGAGVLQLSADRGERPLSIQMETGTFVLSELSQPAVKAKATAPATVSSVEPGEGVASPSSGRPPAPSPSPSSSPSTPGTAPGGPPKTTFPERSTRTSRSTPGGQPAPLGVLGKLKSFWTAALAWLGWGETARGREDLGIAPTPRERPSRPSVRPVPAASAERALDPDPGDAAAEPPKKPAPREAVGVPSWSVLDEPQSASPEPAASPSANVPDWSMTDNPAEQFRDFFEELGVPLGTDPQPAGDPSSANDTDDLSVADPDFPEDDAPSPSMFSPIPVEELATSEADVMPDVDDDEAIDLDVEIDFEMDAGPEPEPEPEAPEPEPEPETKLELDRDDVAPRPAPAPAPPTPAPMPKARVAATADAPDAPATPEPTDLAREQARRRVQQSGGEARLLRDVKLHFKLRDWQGAVPLLEQLLEISPGKAFYHGMLGRALSRHPGRRKEAEAHFVEALRIAPRDAELHYWLGLYYKSFGLGARALNEFKTTLRINPRHEGARRQLGVTGKSDDALGAVLKKLFG